VIGRDLLHDRQPEPAAAGGPRPRLIPPEEPFEDSLLVFARDADAAVGDGDFHIVTAPTTADRHERPMW
jgi:hypothetical protein